MTTTRSHAPIREVLRAAGYHRAVSSNIAHEGVTAAEEEAWMEERRHSLARMRARKEKRREFGAPGNAPDLYQPELGYGSDTGSGSRAPSLMELPTTLGGRIGASSSMLVV